MSNRRATRWRSTSGIGNRRVTIDVNAEDDGDDDPDAVPEDHADGKDADLPFWLRQASSSKARIDHPSR